jgi:hypothetical protein
MLQNPFAGEAPVEPEHEALVTPERPIGPVGTARSRRRHDANQLQALPGERQREDGHER